MTEDEIATLLTERDTHRDRLALMIEQAVALGHSDGAYCEGTSAAVGDVDCECAAGMFVQMAREVLPPSTTSDLTQFVANLVGNFELPAGSKQTDVESVAERLNLAVRHPVAALAQVTTAQWAAYLSTHGWELVTDDGEPRWEHPDNVIDGILINSPRHLFDVDCIAHIEARDRTLVLVDLLATVPQ